MNYKEMCRACFKRLKNLHQLPESIPPKFEYQGTAVTLIMGKMFKKLLSRHSTGFDQICTRCLSEIERTYLFIKRCEVSNNLIKKHFQQIKSKKNSNPLILNTNEIENNRNLLINQQSFVITEVINSISQDSLMDDSKIAEIDQLDNTKKRTDNFFENEIFVKQELLTDDGMQPETENSFSDNKMLAEDYDKIKCISTIDEPSIEQAIKQEPDLDIHIDDDDEEEEEEEEILDKFCKLCNPELECNSEQHCLKHLPEKSVIVKKLIECSLCRKKFEDKLKYDEHNLTHENSPIFQCSNCSEIFRYKLGLMNHIRTKHKSAKFKCPISVDSSICPKLFETLTARNDHLIKDHPHQLIKGQFTCDICGIYFAKKNNLVRHKKSHKHKKK